MSKVDAMRALREAKHARGGALPDSPGAARPRAAAAPRAAAPPRSAAAEADPEAGSAATSEPPATTEPAAPDELCGHRNMGGKSCSRPAGHSEKNHRYR